MKLERLVLQLMMGKVERCGDACFRVHVMSRHLLLLYWGCCDAASPWFDRHSLDEHELQVAWRVVRISTADLNYKGAMYLLNSWI